MINVQLLRDTLAHIEAHPEEWDQGSYRLDCGTAGCFAWHAAILAGGVPRTGDVQMGDWATVRRVPEDGGKNADAYGNEWMHVSDRAQRVLGLDDDQASGLFNGDNTLDDLRRIVAELTTETTP